MAIAMPEQFSGQKSLIRLTVALSEFDGVVMRSVQTGRVRPWVMRHAGQADMAVELRPRILVNDPDAVCRCVLVGLGIGPLALPHLENGALIRLLPVRLRSISPGRNSCRARRGYPSIS